MSGFDSQPVYYTDQQLVVRAPGADGDDAERRFDASNQELAAALVRFRQFLKEWTRKQTHIYVDQLRANYAQGQDCLVVDMKDLMLYSQELGTALRNSPDVYLPILEEAAKEVLDFTTNLRDLRDIQIQLTGFDQCTGLRDLGSTDISKLVCVPGIVINTTRVQSRASKVLIRCRHCGHTRHLHAPPGLAGLSIPGFCTGAASGNSQALDKCPPNSYAVLPDRSQFIDFQQMKLQERPEDVPTGDMPRHVEATMDRFLVSRVKPGTRVTLIGVYTITTINASKTKKSLGSDSKDLRFPYLRIIGVTQDADATFNFTNQDEDELHELARDPRLYERIAKSIAPQIFGSDDIKRAIACQLFGGTSKSLPDGMRLRGDINVLLLGDPSVAKSQFLKFVERVAPICVYTSGKGSSAAGLTASVIRDSSSREFRLEGGALVLADGGIVCIDEFDKMREQDRVAIHEAMEQQTISIAKAGITTILNSRTAVLAAANPVYGRYDTEKTASENITLQSTILSRFDMIFVILDTPDEEKDARLGRHVISVHMKADVSQTDDDVIPNEVLKKYIAFARQRAHPRLSNEAAETLKNHYVSIRAQFAKQMNEMGDAVVPITVRQLEAITRISESLARMHLHDEANASHVTEALRLFKVSTVQAASTGTIAHGLGDQKFRQSTQQAEDFVRRRLAIGHRCARRRLIDDYLEACNVDTTSALDKALEIMAQRGELRLENRNKSVYRAM